MATRVAVQAEEDGSDGGVLESRPLGSGHFAGAQRDDVLVRSELTDCEEVVLALDEYDGVVVFEDVLVEEVILLAEAIGESALLGEAGGVWIFDGEGLDVAVDVVWDGHDPAPEEVIELVAPSVGDESGSEALRSGESLFGEMGQEVSSAGREAQFEVVDELVGEAPALRQVIQCVSADWLSEEEVIEARGAVQEFCVAVGVVGLGVRRDARWWRGGPAGGSGRGRAGSLRWRRLTGGRVGWRVGIEPGARGKVRDRLREGHPPPLAEKGDDIARAAVLSGALSARETKEALGFGKDGEAGGLVRMFWTVPLKDFPNGLERDRLADDLFDANALLDLFNEFTRIPHGASS